MNKKLNWLSPPPRRLTDEDKIARAAMIQAYVDNQIKTCGNDCTYPLPGEMYEVTAKPLPENKHNFTPVERVTLDYRGKF